ncbi:MAG: nucleoside triphosphate pyrophosphohydrolase [Patescibacteria group bacterium]
MVSYNKLVRDKIPEILRAKHISFEERIADTDEYKSELIEKLREEAEEFTVAGDPEELADVLEVAEALKNLPEYQNVENIRLKKKEERGGFTNRIILKGEK